MIFRYPDVVVEPKSCVMVDGSFDPLHDGHIEYFKAASDLGFPVLCNIASDEWTKQKHAILLEQDRRALVLDSIRFIQYVVIGSPSTSSAIQAVVPRVFVKGNDWLHRGGLPHDERLVCESLGVEIHYLDTVRNSSSQLLDRLFKNKPQS